jgi:hypothetical protein
MSLSDHGIGQFPNSKKARSLLPILWLIVAGLASALRLLELGAAPLNSSEAVQALASYQTVLGMGEGVQSFAPLLYHGNVLLFSLFGSSDGLARLLPALFGVGLALTPLLLRRHLGKWGSLGMGLMLALSPTAAFHSRLLDGSIGAALGVMVLVGCAVEFLDTYRSNLVVWGGIGLAVALTAGPGAYGLLMGLVLALAGGLWLWWDQIEWVWPIVRPVLGKGLLAAGLGVLALGSGLGLDLPGLSATGGQLIAWLSRFGVARGYTLSTASLTLVAYEPLILLSGLVGIVLVVWRRHGMGLVLTFWAGVGAIELALMPGRLPADLMWVLLPLSGLGAMAVEELAQALSQKGMWLNEGLHLPVSLILWVHSGMRLARYARLGDDVDRLVAALTGMFQLLLAAAFGFAVSVPEPEEPSSQALRRGLRAAVRALGLSLAIVLVCMTLATVWGLSHLRPVDPRELEVRDAVAVEILTLADTVARVDTLSAGNGEPIALVGDVDPALEWALREFDLTKQDDPRPEWYLLGAVERPPLILAPSSFEPPLGYYGESFPVRRAWAPSWGGNEAARWLLYRESSVQPAVTEYVVLWVREDLVSSQ